MKKLLFVFVILSACSKPIVKPFEIYKVEPIKVDSIDIYLNKSMIEFRKFLYHHNQIYKYIYKDIEIAEKYKDSMLMADKMQNYYDKRHAILLNIEIAKLKLN